MGEKAERLARGVGGVGGEQGGPRGLGPGDLEVGRGQPEVSGLFGGFEAEVGGERTSRGREPGVQSSSPASIRGWVPSRPRRTAWY